MASMQDLTAADELEFVDPFERCLEALYEKRFVYAGLTPLPRLAHTSSSHPRSLSQRSGAVRCTVLLQCKGKGGGQLPMYLSKAISIKPLLCIMDFMSSSQW